MSGAINLKYRKFVDSYKPVIPIEIQYKKGSVAILVLVDSGADKNVFHADLCEILGIDLEAGEYEEFGGIAPNKKDDKPLMIPAYGHKVGLTVGGVTRNSYAYFTKNLSTSGYSIVGQLGFFDKFKSVKFDYNNRRIVIKP